MGTGAVWLFHKLGIIELVEEYWGFTLGLVYSSWYRSSGNLPVTRVNQLGKGLYHKFGILESVQE